MNWTEVTLTFALELCKLTTGSPSIGGPDAGIDAIPSATHNDKHKHITSSTARENTAPQCFVNLRNDSG